MPHNIFITSLETFCEESVINSLLTKKIEVRLSTNITITVNRDTKPIVDVETNQVFTLLTFLGSGCLLRHKRMNLIQFLPLVVIKRFTVKDSIREFLKERNKSG